MVGLLHLEGLPPERREDPVGPVVGGHVQPTKHLTGSDGLEGTFKLSIISTPASTVVLRPLMCQFLLQLFLLITNKKEIAM